MSLVSYTWHVASDNIYTSLKTSHLPKANFSGIEGGGGYILNCISELFSDDYAFLKLHNEIEWGFMGAEIMTLIQDIKDHNFQFK